MRTLTEQLHERHARIRKLGGTIPTAVGSIERQLHEADAEIKRLLWNEKTDAVTAAKRSKLVECYEAMGFSVAEARIAAGVDRAVRSKDVNRTFDAGVKLGM